MCYNEDVVFTHETVLLNEAVKALAIKSDGIYVDATFGRGGHSALILQKLSKAGRLFGFDQDEEAIKSGEERFAKELSAGKFQLIDKNFSQLKNVLDERGISKIDGILYDLGVSSPQFDDAKRGFSYKKEARLDMRMNKKQSLDAYEVVNNYSFLDLQKIFFRYGEEPYAKQIARKIEQRRLVSPIEGTLDLAAVIKSALPQKVLKKKGHPAKRIFQAIRIEVNQELEVAESSLLQAIDLVKPGGRIAVITFHSLEDRLVKQLFKEKSQLNIPRGLPVIPDEMLAPLKLITRKPIQSGQAELEKNNRAHSAKLRIAEKQR